MKDDRGEADLTFLAEQHAKEIWVLKEQISKQSEELTVLRGTKDVVVRLTNELVRMKKRAQEAEGELTIIKGIGNTSPEMKNLQARVKELEDSLAAALGINDDHQRYNGKLQARLTEVEVDNKKLSKQIDDYLNKFRNAGL
jgi:F0F1-type ATP synthase epsilon subunit